MYTAVEEASWLCSNILCCQLLGPEFDFGLCWVLGVVSSVVACEVAD